MSLRQEYGRLLSRLLPVGLVGASLLLGASASANANLAAANANPTAAPPAAASVAERLAAIRGAVTDLGERGVKPHEAETQLAWGNWRNGGGRSVGWRNGGWGNGGWRNGGWRNGGWGNGWPNWWHNW